MAGLNFDALRVTAVEFLYPNLKIIVTDDELNWIHWAEIIFKLTPSFAMDNIVAGNLARSLPST